MIIRTLVFSVMLLFAAPSAADRFYQPRLQEVKWQVRASELECVMAQEIPRYGTAKFVQKAGEGLKFQVEVKRAPIKVAYARLSSMPPDWRYDVAIRDLGRVSILKSKTPIEVDTVRAHRLLNELQAGMYPTIRYEDWFDGRDDVQVSVSAVNIDDSMDRFLDCLDQILPYGLDEIQDTTFFYQYGKEVLSDVQEARLDRIADYVVADKTIQAIEIHSYTDSIGYRRKNLEESQRRAARVRGYLMDRGVDEELFVTFPHGEKDPKYDNETEEGRAKNRRVTIHVSREAPDIEGAEVLLAEHAKDDEAEKAAEAEKAEKAEKAEAEREAAPEQGVVSEVPTKL